MRCKLTVPIAQRLAPSGSIQEAFPIESKRLACAQASLVFPPPAASAASPAVISLPVNDGMVIIGSDAHYWPGSPSTAHSAFVRTIRELEPHTVILNGDVFDGAAVSKHTSIGWEKRPTVAEELAVCQERLAEIVAAGPPGTELIWTMGNHDMRYETFLANNAPAVSQRHWHPFEGSLPSVAAGVASQFRKHLRGSTSVEEWGRGRQE